MVSRQAARSSLKKWGELNLMALAWVLMNPLCFSIEIVRVRFRTGMEKISHRDRLFGDILQIADHVLRFPINQDILVTSLKATARNRLFVGP